MTSCLLAPVFGPASGLFLLLFYVSGSVAQPTIPVVPEVTTQTALPTLWPWPLGDTYHSQKSSLNNCFKLRRVWLSARTHS